MTYVLVATDAALDPATFESLDGGECLEVRVARLVLFGTLHVYRVHGLLSLVLAVCRILPPISAELVALGPGEASPGLFFRGHSLLAGPLQLPDLSLRVIILFIALRLVTRCPFFWSSRRLRVWELPRSLCP